MHVVEDPRRHRTQQGSADGPVSTRAEHHEIDPVAVRCEHRARGSPQELALEGDPDAVRLLLDRLEEVVEAFRSQITGIGEEEGIRADGERRRIPDPGGNHRRAGRRELHRPPQCLGRIR